VAFDPRALASSCRRSRCPLGLYPSRTLAGSPLELSGFGAVRPDREPTDAGLVAACASLDGFTIFEVTSEIQRMIIGRAVTGLDVR